MHGLFKSRIHLTNFCRFNTLVHQRSSCNKWVVCQVKLKAQLKKNNRKIILVKICLLYYSPKSPFLSYCFRHHKSLVGKLSKRHSSVRSITAIHLCSVKSLGKAPRFCLTVDLSVLLLFLLPLLFLSV